MLSPKEVLNDIPAGRVLDVATGAGGFIQFLLDGLNGYTEIIGIDTNARGQAAFAEAFETQPKIRFEQMDALQLDFGEASFDLVCISNSLHHFDDPAAVLRQMARVLRPSGHFLVAEMYCDEQAETQQTHVELHHWWAAVDRAGGVTHHPTYRRADLISMVNGLDLVDLKLYDLNDLSDDPHHPELLEELGPVIDRYIQRSEGHADLQGRGEQLRQRLQTVGFHSATSLVALGIKP